jgi:ubiquinone/menaquinone biosynthesis C-methylase UbiE
MNYLIQKQEKVREFWNNNPCDSHLSTSSPDECDYYLEIERERYTYQGHIPEILGWINWNGKNVLEIGTGVGTDARMIIRRGGTYTGINIDQGSVAATKKALKVFGAAGTVKQCNGTSLVFDDASVDVIYSFGVLHHIPDVNTVVKEIHRVLKPNGELLIMLYNKNSINYKIEIMFIRKLMLHLLNIPGVIPLFGFLGLPEEKLYRHAEIFREFRSMDKQEWLNRNTDGPDNPYSLVYNEQETEKLLAQSFKIKANKVFFFDPRHWGVLGRILPNSLINYLGARWGWHRIVYAVKSD